MNPGTPPGFPRSHRLCEEPPTRGAQPTRLKPALTRSAGWTAVLSAHRHPRGWGPHSPAGGPLCPHAARKTEGRRRISKPTGQPRRAGLCPPSAGAAGRHLCRGAGALGLRAEGSGCRPAPQGPPHCAEVTGTLSGPLPLPKPPADSLANCQPQGTRGSGSQQTRRSRPRSPASCPQGRAWGAWRCAQPTAGPHPSKATVSSAPGAPLSSPTPGPDQEDFMRWREKITLSSHMTKWIK